MYLGQNWPISTHAKKKKKRGRKEAGKKQERSRKIGPHYLVRIGHFSSPTVECKVPLGLGLEKVDGS
jgi:hypothetical protein